MSDRILPNRRSIRLQNYDYSKPGVYFITVCTHGRKCLFGNIRDGKMITNAAGKAVQEIWDGLPIRFPYLVLDAFIMMPNHVHAILALFRTPRKRTGAASCLVS
jgi:putative transposase